MIERMKSEIEFINELELLKSNIRINLDIEEMSRIANHVFSCDNKVKEYIKECFEDHIKCELNSEDNVFAIVKYGTDNFAIECDHCSSIVVDDEVLESLVNSDKDQISFSDNI